MRVTFVRSEDQAQNIRSFWFKPERPVRYTAGQFIELTLPHDNPDNRGNRRWFTLFSSPTEEMVGITTKFTPDKSSSFKQTLSDLQPGDEVVMSEPMGDFVLPKDPSVPLVFIAGGIGITPMRSMIKWLYDNQEHRTIHLIYAANVIEEVAFRKLFNEYGCPTDIVLGEPPNGWDGLSGQLDASRVLELAPDVDRKLYFISGPEQMVESLFDGLKDLGVDKKRLVGDYFPGYVI